MSGRLQNIGIAVLVVVMLYATILWAGQEDIDDILYYRLNGTGMSSDSIELVMALPRCLIMEWEEGPMICTTYLDLAPAVAAAVIIEIDPECIDQTVLFDYNYLRRSKK